MTAVDPFPRAPSDPSQVDDIEPFIRMVYGVTPRHQGSGPGFCPPGCTACAVVLIVTAARQARKDSETLHLDSRRAIWSDGWQAGFGDALKPGVLEDPGVRTRSPYGNGYGIDCTDPGCAQCVADEVLTGNAEAAMRAIRAHLDSPRDQVDVAAMDRATIEKIGQIASPGWAL